jgi:hypothetical protein
MSIASVGGMTMRRLPTMSAFIGALPLWLAAGCVTPGPLVRLAPTDPGMVWAAGRAVVSKEDTGVRVAVAFEHQADDVLALQVDVENHTEARFDVSPADVTYATCSSQTPLSCAPPARVVDPEQVLDTLEALHADHVATARNAQPIAPYQRIVGVTPAGTTSDMVPASTAVDTAYQTYRRGRAEEARMIWADAFRRTTLFPGQGYGGPVYIPVVPTAKLVRLQVMVGARKFQFSFAQTEQEIQYARPADPRPSPSNMPP